MALSKARALQEAEKSVAQGKITQAIRQYLEILENDPSDVSLLNTVGDLYVRERNISEGLRHFHRLAEVYVREGFNVKAIAMYRKISKVDPNSVETLLKLGELYQLQGLSREAREQYLQAVEVFKKRNQADRVLDVLRKLVQLDPENSTFRSRLAKECERTGRPEEAAQAYLESAEVLLLHDDVAAAETALTKAAELAPKNPQVQLLRVRVAMSRQQPEEAEKIISSSADLLSDPAAKQLLLECYLASGKLSQAEELVMEVYRANPSDFTPVSNFSALCLEKGTPDSAFEPLSRVADELIEQGNTGPLMESLRRVWNKAPQHIPTLELLRRICVRTSDEFTLPEVLEGLGHAYVQAGDLEKAEAAYQKLAQRDPESEHHRGLLKQVQQKLGKQATPTPATDLSATEMALSPEGEAAQKPAPGDTEQEAVVKEAIENSDLFARYNLVDKAVAELDSVLQLYPDQIQVHRRILEICQKGLPNRAAVAAGALARIFKERGDLAAAKKYEAIASAKGAVPELPQAPPPLPPPVKEVEEPVATPPAPAATQEPSLTAQSPISAIVSEKPAETAPPSPAEVALDLTPPATPGELPPAQGFELDLSGDLEALTALAPRTAAPPAEEAAAPASIPPATGEALAAQATQEAVAPVGIPPASAETPAASPAEAASSDIEEGKVEVDFYLEHGFVDEARGTVGALEEEYPGNKLVAELRRRVEERSSEAPAEEPEGEVAPAAPADQPAHERAAVSAEPAPKEWELPSTYAAMPEPPSVAETVGEEPAAVKSARRDLLGDLAEDLASGLEGVAAPTAGAAPAAAPTPGAAQLSGLLEEMEGPGSSMATAQDDPETHYNLGVAFREMALLDEAIGEFQQVVKGAGKEHLPANFLQACSLLAICFMEKKMPAIAVKWYTRALEAPGLDDDAILALQYDLGVAYEQAGDARKALERFTEVYSQNIDFRDVAEKIRVLQQKV
jgi:tetratricopeptide (TPR) repeat protein